MFNTQHILYMVVSGVLTAILLYLASKNVKKQSRKDLILKISAVITVIIHFSDLWVSFFQTGGNTYVESVHIFPMYPCNIIMWMLLILAFIDNKKGKLFTLLAEFCFVIGLVCGIIGILLNKNFDANPTLSDYDVLKGLLSHSTMIFGCFYLFTAGYVKPKISSTLSLAFGFTVFAVCGLTMNALYSAFGMNSPDGIWIKGVPYLNVSSLILGFLVLVIYFLIFALLELRLPQEERWYYKLKKKFKK